MLIARLSPNTHLVLLLLWTALFTTPALAAPVLMENGQPRAQIVIADQPPRMARLAAEQLQTYLEKISGAKLPIVSAPNDELPYTVYVGRSAHTESLDLAADGDLDYGAFHLKTGDTWLALVGDDEDFVPSEPWARHHPDKERMMTEWRAKTGSEYWGNPIGTSLYRSHTGRMEIWEYDRHGSLNAVNQFLRSLGVRWYMPGELGEIVPTMQSITVSAMDEVVRPDYPMRHMMFAQYGATPVDHVLWYLRLGLNHGHEIAGPGGGVAHEMRQLTNSEKLQQDHPEYFAIWGGRRMNDGRHAKPCLSSEGLFEENVRFVRAVFDIYDTPMVSVMPPDGYARVCECERCEGKGTPERGRLGSMSDYVWGYVNRVAKEVYKTHPDKTISCFAYGTYTLPPEKIEQLSPNIVVGIVHGRGKHFDQPEVRQEKLEIAQAWREMSSHDLMVWEHYVFTHRGPYDGPVYFPRAIAAGLNGLKDLSLGEFVEVAIGPLEKGEKGLHTPGFNHLNVYVTARLYWDAEQDIDALLDEYYDKFYGPAAAPMKSLIEFSEAHWPELRTTPAAANKQSVVDKIDRIFELIGEAEAAVAPDSAYAQRVALLADYLQPLKNQRAQLAKGRENVPEVRISAHRNAGIELDGRLDEAAWEGLRTYQLREVQTGRDAAARTTFRAFWEGGRDAGSLYVGIRCEDPDMANLKITATEDGDDGIFLGDNIELLIETQPHSYYQMVISPAGALVDLDRSGRGLNRDWSSQIEVATHIGDDAWYVEARIPVSGTDTIGDPLHELVGKQPREDYPWYINVGRQRVRGDDTELSAFAPTGIRSYHDVMKFGRLYVR